MMALEASSHFRGINGSPGPQMKKPLVYRFVTFCTNSRGHERQLGKPIDHPGRNSVLTSFKPLRREQDH
jgi:hypothetical protein